MRFIQKVFLTMVFTAVPLVLTVWLIAEHKQQLRLTFGLPYKASPLVLEEADDMFFGVLPWSEEAQEFLEANNATSNSSSDCIKHESTCSFLVNGLGCSISFYKPFHKGAEPYLKTEKVTCKRTSYVVAKGNILMLNKNMLAKDRGIDPKDVKCFISAIHRSKTGDSDMHHELVLDDFKDTYESQHDFLEVTCHRDDGAEEVYNDFFAFIHKKPDVEKICEKAAQKYENESSTSKQKDRLNILMLGFDSMSHLNFLRRLPMSYKYLKRNLSAIELQGYTKLADNTFPCVIPMFTGKFAQELPRSSKGPYDDYPLIWKHYIKRGYRTQFAEDYPWISIFNHERKGFKYQPTDYYLRPFYLAAEGSEMRKGTENEHCFNSRLEVNVVFDWVLEFIRLFRDKPYFSLTFLTRLFHGLMNEPENADPFFYKLLSQADDEGLLNNTVLMVFSDHGLRATKFRATPMGKYEERLPLFLISFPKWFPRSHPAIYRNLLINQRRLTTMFDIHEFLKDLLDIPESAEKASLKSRGNSLFREIPLERTCGNAAIKPQWCMCKKYEKVPTTLKEVTISANALADKINYITESQRNSCAVLTVNNIMSAQAYTVDNEWTWLQITFEAVPGNGLFEGTTKYNRRTQISFPTLDFSRINRYGNQSDCIHNDFLRIFCYCTV